MEKKRNIGSLPIPEEVKEVIRCFMVAEFIVVTGHNSREVESFKKSFLNYVCVCATILSDRDECGQVSTTEFLDTLLESSRMFDSLANSQYYQFSAKLRKLASIVKKVGSHELN